MTDENRTTFDNYIKLIDRAEFLKHKVYDHIITELSDLNFLTIQLGKYQAPFIKAIKDNLPKFESIVNTEIEVNNYDEIEVDAILTQKQKAESLVNSILEFSKDNANIFQKTNEEFESYFKSLYDKTNNDYKGKNREFLQKKADEITKALHDAKHNYTISEFAENYIFDLEYLRTEIDTEIQNSFVVKKVANKKGAGRTKVELKPFEAYIVPNWNEKGIEVFEAFIKQEFKKYGTDYKNGVNKENLHLLIYALIDLKVIKETTAKNQFSSVAKLILGETFNPTESNIDYYRKLPKKKEYKEEPEYAIITSKIKNKFVFMETYKIQSV